MAGHEKFILPDRIKNEQGEIRKAGFELEFAGLPLEKAVEIVIEVFGGSSSDDDPFQQKVTGSKYGEFAVELDAQFFKDRKYKKYLQKVGINLDDIADQSELESFLGTTASLIVPVEIVTPPIPFSEFETLEILRDSLHKNQAKGTADSFFYAFGLHINPEVPSLKTNDMLQYLRAFLLLYEWIMEVSDIDVTRRITPYIDPFPDDYIKLVLDSSYAPESEKLIKDYLQYNPTRNRPLDFTPLFASIDEELVKNNVEEQELVKKRPAFHYRLPNCSVGQPDWSIAKEWNTWSAVEKLADDQEKIKTVSKDYLETKDSLIEKFANQWPKKIRHWQDG